MSVFKIAAAVGAALGAPFAAKVGEKLLDKFIDKVVVDRVNSGLDKVITATFNAWKAGHGQSLISASQAVRVEPFVLVDVRASRLPYIKDVMNVAQRLYTSYYLLANAAENTIAGVKVAKRLDKFATDRDLKEATVSFLSDKGYGALSSESYQFGLPFVGEAVGLHRWGTFSNEANNPVGDHGPKVNGVSYKANSIASDVANLAVGQIVDVTITDGKSTATVPVQIKLRPLGMESGTIAELFALGGEDNSFGARALRVKVGEISLWRDLVMKQDQVERYRRAVMSDKSGYFRRAASRDNKNTMATILTGTPSVGDAVSIAIITRDTLRDAEEKMDRPITDFATRQQVFDEGMMMLLFVVDPDHETVTIFTKDIEDYGTYALRDLKSAGSGDKSDLADIMKSYLEGRVPGRL